MKKRILALILALVMCLGLLPVTALAEEDGFNIRNGELTSYKGPGGDVTIPDGVTSIWPYAFIHNKDLTSVTIPNSVTSIGEKAFEDCGSLTSVTIGGGVTGIGKRAFWDCESLTNMTIPDSVTSLGESAFAGCTNLTSVTIGSGVTGIPRMAFYGCENLTGITIGSSVTSIGAIAFQDCKSLTSVTLPDGVTSIGERAFWDCESLTDVTIPGSVTSIGDGAFSGCLSLTEVPFNASDPDFVLTDGVLFSKDGKTLVTYPGGKKGAYTIPNSVTRIGNSAFSGCKNLTGVTIPNSVTGIGESAFLGCEGLTAVTIPDSVTGIEKSAFLNCYGLTSVTLPNSITSIERSVFGNCRLTGITIPNSVTRIEQEAFMSSSGLTGNLTIPGSVTSIGMRAFNGCSGLTSVTIPVSVTSIERDAFANGHNLKDIYYEGTEAQWNAISIDKDNITITDAVIHFNTPMPAQPQQSAGIQADPTNDSLTVNGAEQNPTVYKINGNNYFKIRDLAAILNGTEKQFDVDYDSALKSVAATTGKGYVKQSGDLAGAPAGGGKTAMASNDTIYIDGEKVEAEVYKIDGSNYFKLRDLGKALDFYVGWEAGRGMYIETDKPYS